MITVDQSSRSRLMLIIFQLHEIDFFMIDFRRDVDFWNTLFILKLIFKKFKEKIITIGT